MPSPGSSRRAGRLRPERPRDALGRPLAHGEPGVAPIPERALAPGDALDLARRLTRQGRPFAAHEVLEARWKTGPDAERDLWQGLAQLCVAITHALRGNPIGARRLLDRGADRLAAHSAGGGPTYGLDVAATVDCAARQVAAALEG